MSCDFEFVKNIIQKYLLGQISYLALTDNKHNGKSSQGKALLLGNKVTTIGLYHIDVGLLPLANIASELYVIKDFANDMLVLQLLSADTISKVLNIHGQDLSSQLFIVLVMVFERAHLFGVNYKGNLSSKFRIILLWSSMIFFLHIDGVSYITKRSGIAETVALVFLLMRQDVKLPH